MASQPPSPRKRPSTDASQLALAMELPFIMIGAVVIGGGFGYFLDTKLHTAPMLALILGFLGFGAGIWEIVRRLSTNEKNQNGGGN
ncbi:MAG: AtpZ/AtpI family protein [Candidatus Acidiferrales bacterium]